MTWVSVPGELATVEAVTSGGGGVGVGRLSGVGQARGVTITQVAQILGVPMPTLRSWEARYGIPSMIRRTGQHRRYSPVELHCLRLMRDEIARGVRARDAADRVRALQQIQGLPGELVTRFLGAAAQGDAARLQEVLDTAAALIGDGACVDEVMLPALRQVGSFWTAGVCDAGPERVAIQAIRGWLGRRSAALPSPAGQRPVVIACGPGDGHTVGAEALALLLRSRRRPVRLLGSRVHLPTLIAAINECDAAAVVITAQLATGRRPTATVLHHLQLLPMPLFYAGNAFHLIRGRQRTPGTFLGNSITGAAELIITALDPPPATT